MRWKPIAEDAWQEVNGEQTFFAIRDGQGRVVRLAVDFAGAQLERSLWFSNRLYVFKLVGGGPC